MADGISQKCWPWIISQTHPLHWRESHMSHKQRRRKLENFEGDGDKKFRVKGGYPLETSSVFGPFVYWLWTMLLFFLIFLSFSWFLSLIFLPQNFRGDVPLTENFRRGHVTHPPPPPHFSRLCLETTSAQPWLPLWALKSCMSKVLYHLSLNGV